MTINVGLPAGAPYSSVEANSSSITVNSSAISANSSNIAVNSGNISTTASTITRLEGVKTVSTSTTIVDADAVFVETTADITLQTSPPTGDRRIIKNTGVADITLDGNGNLIDGNATVTIRPLHAFSIKFTGSAWRIFA